MFSPFLAHNPAPMDQQNTNVTSLLIRLRDGDEDAIQLLFPVVYDSLLLIAGNQLNREYGSNTLNKTGLVHEAFIKLIDAPNIEWQDRGHFYAIAAKAMRQILTDHARKKLTEKRGNRVNHVTLDEGIINLDKQANNLVDIDQALKDLFEVNDRLGKIVELRFYAGLSMEETGDILGISLRTVGREWAKARAWLFKRLNSAH